MDQQTGVKTLKAYAGQFSQPPQPEAVDSRFGNPAVGPEHGLHFGLGYEWITTRLEGELFANPIEASASHSGPELLHVQGGVDLAVAPGLAVGPFASLSGVRYTTCSTELSGEELDCEIEDGAWHGWLVVGVRGALGL